MFRFRFRREARRSRAARPIQKIPPMSAQLFFRFSFSSTKRLRDASFVRDSKNNILYTNNTRSKIIRSYRFIYRLGVCVCVGGGGRLSLSVHRFRGYARKQRIQKFVESPRNRWSLRARLHSVVGSAVERFDKCCARSRAIGSFHARFTRDRSSIVTTSRSLLSARLAAPPRVSPCPESRDRPRSASPSC